MAMPIVVTRIVTKFVRTDERSQRRRLGAVDERVGLDGGSPSIYSQRAMKHFVSSLLMLGSLTLPCASRLYAANPPKSLDKGRVLILKNEHTMEGDIERVGDHYRVRRSIGETWVLAERAVPGCLVAGCLCVPAGTDQPG